MRYSFILFSCCLVACSASNDSSPHAPKEKEQPSVNQIAKEFATYAKLTPQPVLVNPELAALCVGVSQKILEGAREEHGPHAHTAITIYMNESARNAFAQAAAKYPVGAVVVKQKMGRGYWGSEPGELSRIPNGVGGMVKRPAGYDPKNGDWEYFYFEQLHEIESGRLSSCIECHKGAKESDYVFGNWRSLKLHSGSLED